MSATTLHLESIFHSLQNKLCAASQPPLSFSAPPLLSLSFFFSGNKNTKKSKNDLNSNEAEMTAARCCVEELEHKGRGKGVRGGSATAHLRPNMIYDLAGELHVMIERVDQGVCAIQKDCGEAENRQRCRSIAPHLPPPRAFCHSVPRLRASVRLYITPESRGRSGSGGRRTRGIHSA